VTTFNEQLDSPPATIPPQQHIKAIFPKAGTVNVEVTAVAAGGKPLVNGRGTAALVSGQEVRLVVVLTPFE
jgi:hypothetical protein